MLITLDKYKVKLTNLNKVLWPEQGFTKKDMIDYYAEIYPLIKDYLKNRPLSLKLYPDGINGKTFYQKNCPDHAPDWLTTTPVYSKHRQGNINWVMINKVSDLAWVANHASIELHGWFSTIKHPENPDFAVFDLDPGTATDFSDTVQVALIIKNLLDEINLMSLVKTSGQSGLHVYIPVKSIYSYKQIQQFLKNIADILLKLKQELVTTAWHKDKRQGKVYIDYRQNAHSKTIPAPYSLRPTPQATVSTPISWPQLETGIKPTDFTLDHIQKHLDQYNNIWQDIMKIEQKLPDFLTNFLLFFFFFSSFHTGL